MPFSTAWLLFFLFLLVIISAFFSGSEIGMMSLNRYRLRHLAKQKNKTALRVNALLSRPDRLLSIILIGNTLANIVASTIATIIAQRLYGDAGIAAGTLLLTLVILVFAEMTPKTLAALHPERVAFVASLPLRLLQTMFSPVVYFISAITNGILRVFGVSISQIQKEALTAEELKSVVHEAGTFMPAEHRSMLLSLLDLEQATVEDIMVPKTEIIGLDISLPWHELREQIETVQHTRLPLYDNSIDNLIGVIHMRDVLNVTMDGQLSKDSLRTLANTPYYTPEATTLNLQLLNFQKMKQRSCFVVDEYGELLGLITIEDILEEVVGEFTTDFAAFSKDIIPQKDGSYIIDASITLRQLKRILHWELPQIGPRTLNGYIVEFLGAIPPADCCMRIDPYQIDILRVSDNMIKTVRMKPIIPKQRIIETD